MALHFVIREANGNKDRLVRQPSRRLDEHVVDVVLALALFVQGGADGYASVAGGVAR